MTLVLSEAVLMFVAARNQQSGARLLLETQEYAKGVQLLGPAHLLLGQSVENYLKAFLVKTGTPSKDLKKAPVNHDLKLLLGRCRLQGLGDLGPAFDEFVDRLGPSHRDFSFRYYRDGPYDRFQPLPTIAAMEALEGRLEQVLAADLEPFM